MPARDFRRWKPVRSHCIGILTTCDCQGGQVDSRRFPNGRYYLRALAVDERTRMNDHATNQMFGEVGIPVDIANEEAVPHHLAVNWGHIVLAPGQSEQLAARVVDTAGNVVTNAPLHFRSENPTVAAVDPAGRVTGLKPGVTRLTLQSGEVVAEVPVSVYPPSRGFPHFGRGGERRAVFDPARSLFSISCFYLSADECLREPALLPFLRDAAITSLEEANYVNPHHFANRGEREAWRAYVIRNRWETARAFAEREDFQIIAIAMKSHGCASIWSVFTKFHGRGQRWKSLARRWRGRGVYWRWKPWT